MDHFGEKVDRKPCREDGKEEGLRSIFFKKGDGGPQKRIRGGSVAREKSPNFPSKKPLFNG